MLLIDLRASKFSGQQWVVTASGGSKRINDLTIQTM